MSSMNRLKSIYDDRVSKIAAFRTLALRYGFSSDDIKIHRATVVVIMYANWEGFIKEVFKEYLEYINAQGCAITDLNDRYYALLVNKSLILKESLTDFEKIIKRCEKLRLSLQEVSSFKTDVSTESNANWKVVNSIFIKLGIENPIDENTYSRRLDKLLFYRNSIAHGSDQIPITQQDIDEFSQLIEELMELMILKLEDAIRNQIWIRNSHT